MRSNRSVPVLAIGLALAPLVPASAQQPGDTVTVAAGPQYRAGAFKRFWLGDNWRDLWTTPVRVPVLDLTSFAGGLTPERQGGGNQSVTLHMEDAQGRSWLFRSIDKFPEQGLPPEFPGAPAGALLEDQISGEHPGAHFILPRLLEAAGILHVRPELYVMPDHPALGEFRETFAGMLGGLEVIPNEGPDDTPGWGGSTKIKGWEQFANDLEESPEFRVDAPEFLRARLIDFLVGDADRGTDQWRWVRYGEEGDYVYRPLPRDRDWAFQDAEALLIQPLRGVYPKLTTFGRDHSDIESLTYASHILDRRLLTGLTRADFQRATADVQGALTDDVIAAAVADMPPAYVPLAAQEMAAVLRARRDALAPLAMEFYEVLATDVDVRGTDEADLAEVRREADGRVHVRLSLLDDGAVAGASGPASAYYERTFLPAETGEVRLFLHGDDDHALVTGDDGGPIIVRVIGGGGDDILEDRTGTARLYDNRGDNELRTATGTRVDARPWDPPPPAEGLRLGRDWAPDWGGSSGFGPAAGYAEGAGLIVGASWGATRYGFRRLPYAWSMELSALYATGDGGFGVAADVDYRLENSRLALTLEGRATQFEAFRFFGFGNDTEELPTSRSLVMQDQARLYPALTLHLGPMPGRQSQEAQEAEEDDQERPFGGAGRARAFSGTVSLGPLLQWTSPRLPPGSPLAAGGDTDDVTQLGGLMRLRAGWGDRPVAPRRGFAVAAHASAYPALGALEGHFGDAYAEAAGYLPLLGQTHLAVRVGGERAFGTFPAFEAALLGGRTTLRGYRWNRFAGDAMAFGNAELRVPLDTVPLFFNGELGVFGAADAGRVWVDGASPGSWHTAFGGGVWFAFLGRALSAAYMSGESGRAYLWMGLPY